MKELESVLSGIGQFLIGVAFVYTSSFIASKGWYKGRTRQTTDVYLRTDAETIAIVKKEKEQS